MDNSGKQEASNQPLTTSYNASFLTDSEIDQGLTKYMTELIQSVGFFSGLF
jgi:hypothetical protein